MDVCFPPQPSFSQLDTSLLGVRSLMVSVVQIGYNILYLCVDISMEQLGLGRNRPDPKTKYQWDYASLAHPIDIPEETPWSASIYRGLVPAKNILNHDLAVNGAMVCSFLLYHSFDSGTRKTNDHRLSLTIMGTPNYQPTVYFSSRVRV
jgi:hypothetical protein